MSDVWFTIEFPNGESISFTKRIVLGVLFLGIAAFIRLRAVDNWEEWRNTHRRIGPSLDGYDPPVILAYRGLAGCLTSLLLSTFWIVSGAIGLDLIMFEGRVLWTNGNEIMTFFASIPQRLRR